MIAFSSALALNHLLEQQGWARERLARHAGSRVELRTPPFPALKLLITESGLVSPTDDPCDLKVSINPVALPLLVTRSPQAFSHIAMEGPEGLAQTVKELLIELQWDAEEDLSHFIGDAPAHGIAQAGRDLYAWQKEALERLALNFSEYWSEEQPLVARRAGFESFARQVGELQSALDRLEARLQQTKAGPGK